jgi:hypothetical protein
MPGRPIYLPNFLMHSLKLEIRTLADYRGFHRLDFNAQFCEREIWKTTSYNSPRSQTLIIIQCYYP